MLIGVDSPAALDMEAGSAPLFSGKSGLTTKSDVSGAKTTETAVNTSVCDNQSLKISEPALSPAETYRCQICFDVNPIGDAYRLPCQHPYCRECLVNYLQSKITDGQVYPTCFYIDEDAARSEPATTLDGSANMNKYHTCGEAIPPEVIQALLNDQNDELYEKYKRFKFSKENKNARECPFCSTWNIADPEMLTMPSGGRMVCSNRMCGKTFCFYHANAHDFDIYPTCAEYEAAVAPVQKASEDLIASVSKACPSCGVMVMKSGGCNHMKCQCGAAFCWLCGKQIEDTLFPAHFQWWNPSGCSNLQMNDATVPSTCARFCARLLSIVQIILFGPITLVSTLTSSVLCCGCLVLKLRMGEGGCTLTATQQLLSTCMSSWGFFWMIVLLIIPFVLAFGSAAVIIIAVGAVVTYPCYAISRMRENEYPWPDRVTNFFRRARRYFVQRRYRPVRRQHVAEAEAGLDLGLDLESGRDSSGEAEESGKGSLSPDRLSVRLTDLEGGEDQKEGQDQCICGHHGAAVVTRQPHASGQEPGQGTEGVGLCRVCATQGGAADNPRAHRDTCQSQDHMRRWNDLLAEIEKEHRNLRRQVDAEKDLGSSGMTVVMYNAEHTPDPRVVIRAAPGGTAAGPVSVVEEVDCADIAAASEEGKQAEGQDTSLV